MVHFKVNGRVQTFDGDPEMPLLWYLRDELAAYRNQVWLRHGALRSLHRPTRMGRRSAPASTPMRAVSCRQGYRDDRRPLHRKGCIQCRKPGSSLNVPQCGYCQSGQIMQAPPQLS